MVSLDDALATDYLLYVGLLKSKVNYSKNLHVIRPPFLLVIGAENFELMTYANSMPWAEPELS